MHFKQYLKLFKIRSFIFLILSATTWQFGSSLTHMLLITMVGIANPGKVFALSKASLTFTLPVIIFSPLIGILVDHWSRRNTLFRVNILKAIILILTPFLIAWTHSYYPFWIVIFLFFSIDIFNNTAKPALLPMLVARRKLLIANSLDQFLGRFAMVAGMVLGGFIIVKIGWQGGFAFNSLIHIIAGILILGIATKYNSKPNHLSDNHSTISQSFVILGKDLKEIIHLISKDRLVTIILASFALLAFISSVSFTILIFLLQQTLKMGTAGVGIMRGMLAVGMIGGALILGIFKIKISKLNIIILGFLIYGLLFAIGPFCITRLFIIIIALLGGIIFSLIMIAQNTILQEQVASQTRGRIFAIKELLFNITFIITAILIGIVGDLTSFKIVLFGVGIILIILSISAMILTSKTKTEEKLSH